MGQLVLRWTFDHPVITIARAGVRNAEQALQNTAAINGILLPVKNRFVTETLNLLFPEGQRLLPGASGNF